MAAMMGESAGSTMPATGRPGRAAVMPSLDCTRSTVPALSSHLTPAGYEPAQLDAALRSYLATCEKSVRIAESLGKKVEEAVNTLIAQMQAATDYDGAAEHATLATTLHERLSKANLNLVKSTDELTRLRSFLAGGPDSRPDLTVKGEVELRVLLFAAVKKLGLRVTTDNGVEVEA
jgi:hypothetical protein